MKIVDGNKACANIAYKFSEICPVYPITPASPMGSSIDNMTNKELNLFDKRVKLIELQSEAGAAASMHGALLSGNLSSTFTASQGLLLMIPDMYKMAGEMLPGVIHVASRALATHALSIFGDHSDIYAARSTGFCMLASSSVSDAQNLAAVAHLSAIKGSLPFIHFFDGFRTSHEINKIDEIDNEELKKLIPDQELEAFRNRMMLGSNKKERGLAQNEDVFFQISEARNNNYINMPLIVDNYMEEINRITNSNYQPFNYYGSPNATNVVVAMGSVCDTLKLVVDDLNKNNQNVGLIEVHLYRPFSKEYFTKVLPDSVKRVAVLDRTKDASLSGEPLYLDVLNVLHNKDIKVVGGRYGLASKNTTPAMIKAVFDMLDSELKNNFTIGINDDVTNLSLSIPNYKLELDYNEIEIYGFGSDGMVSASKSIMDILGAKEYVQGYFEYDSKKSNGLTISHLRYGNIPIRAPFYPTNPELVVVTKDTYMNRYNVLDGIKDNGTVILNTNLSKEDLGTILPQSFIDTLKLKRLKLYIVDASKIAYESGIKGKISKIMETIILKALSVENYETIINDSIEKAFRTKGEDIVNSNLNAVKSAIDSLVFVDNELVSTISEEKESNIISIINDRKGGYLKVSQVMNINDGSFPCGTSKLEKRCTSKEVPVWNSANCIQCNQCSLVCPHAVIRPFVLDSADEKGVPFLGKPEYKYLIEVSGADCTGCGLCTKVCPGKSGEKALTFAPYEPSKQKEVDELFNKHKNPFVMDKYNIKGSQFCEPKFEFSGACAGCGETPYIKLLTQLVGEKLVVANATGCSSIYGGSMPSMPYLIPWANSLFEDNAEFGFGILTGYNNKKEQIKEIMESTLKSVDENTKTLYETWLNNSNDYDITKDVQTKLKNNQNKDLKDLMDFIPARSIWTIGGDGWAYDIGYGGIDHVLSSNENVNILVLDTEVYSNTGGQASKSSQMGQVCEFANLGKKTQKKDLFAKAITAPNVYVANVCLGSNPMQTIMAFKQAEQHNGPSIIIAYAPCLEHGIKGGLFNAVTEQKLAVDCGYVTLMHYDGKLTIDSPTPDFDKYEEFLANEVRYNALKIKNPSLYEELVKEQIDYAKKRYKHYLALSEK